MPRQARIASSLARYNVFAVRAECLISWYPTVHSQRGCLQVPIMLKSTHCVLHAKTDKELTDLGECPYDQGGYFVVTGSEKVLIAQERMCNNHVYVFPPVSGSEVRVAEIRSQPEGASRPAQALYVKLLRAPKSVGVIHRAFKLVAYQNVQLMFGSWSTSRSRPCLGKFFAPPFLTFDRTSLSSSCSVRSTSCQIVKSCNTFATISQTRR